ncbi:HNH endonuclease signature motif containing protein [Microbacterium sp. CH12i]|uniref:HNH endonuclease signature motif containing protein n=1 Tax=Microbacterium sp. CH12i TaxID=1479651 RepID=UPI001363A3C0|nr:HNH endonuclease signature motif containing protein [Microbacterium sp. CH12i]
MIPDFELELERDSALRDEWVDLGTAVSQLEARRAEILGERFGMLREKLPPGAFDHDVAFRSIAAEFAAAAHMSQGTVEGEFCRADTLRRELPEIAKAFAAGMISKRHVDVIISATVGLAGTDEYAYAVFQARVLEFAVGETAARTAAHAKALVAAIAPATVAERHRSAREDRNVQFHAVGDGMGQLVLTTPEVLGRAAFDRATAMAKIIFEQNKADTSDDADKRTLNQIRADIMTDLLLAGKAESTTGTAAESINATVQVTLTAATLTGDDERMAELDGYGPILPDMARDFASRATSWTRLFLDPEGMAVSTDNYVPTASMKRFLRARDQHCRFPGCRMPVHRCDIDHNHDHARGGPTALCNLSHFCRGHHTLKHPDVDDRYRWTAEQLPGGVIAWTSPSGATYIDEPQPRVMFV